MHDFISIIIPIYNRQNVIEECIRSVEAQSHQNYEVILVDDGSTDDTVSVCRDLAAQNPKIKLTEASHGGVSAARNLAMELAFGDYLFFLDSDDVIHPLLLEDLLKGMEESGAEIGGTEVLNIRENHWHRLHQHMDDQAHHATYTCQNLNDTLNAIFHSATPLNMIGGVMMRRDLIGETRFRTDLFIGEDFDFIYRNLLKSTKSVFLTEKRYYCRIHKGNSSWQYDFPGFWTRFYRRELVWQSEEALGRSHNAMSQKQQAFSIFLNCLSKNQPGSPDCRKMCQTMKAYRSTIFPALSHTSQIRFCLSVYTPRLYLRLLPLLNRLKKKLSK